ncbi:hypothetical protein NMY22_g6150 [Coprinellus aureogranulatus]|nr:hypothetical protein NMY22_g6150 [Coprinellus aureogranulatus]
MSSPKNVAFIGTGAPEAGKTLVNHLKTGEHVVIPTSIHPELEEDVTIGSHKVKAFIAPGNTGSGSEDSPWGRQTCGWYGQVFLALQEDNRALIRRRFAAYCLVTVGDDELNEDEFTFNFLQLESTGRYMGSPRGSGKQRGRGMVDLLSRFLKRPSMASLVSLKSIALKKLRDLASSRRRRPAVVSVPRSVYALVLDETRDNSPRYRRQACLWYILPRIRDLCHPFVCRFFYVESGLDAVGGAGSSRYLDILKDDLRPFSSS